MSKFEVRTTLRTPDIDGFYVVGRVGKQKIITKYITKEFVKFCWLSKVKSFSLELYYQGFNYRYFRKFEADFNDQIEDFFNHPYMEPEIKPHKDKLLFYLKNYKGSK